MRENKDIKPIIKYLTDSGLQSVIADKNLKIIWCSDNAPEDKLMGADLLCLFEENFSLPQKSCTCKGTLNGIPYFYKFTIYYEYYIVEIISSDMLSDFSDNSVSKNIMRKLDVEVRTSISNICTHSTMLYDILKNLKCTEEIDHLNLQRGNCYKILKSISVPLEISRYSSESMRKKQVVSITEVFDEFEKIFSDINPESNINFVSHPDMFVLADKDRLIYVLIELFSLLSDEKSLNINVIAEKTDGYIHISIQKKNTDIKHHSYSLFSNASVEYTEFSNDFILTNLFCRYFSSQLYINKVADNLIACALKIPIAELDINSLKLHSTETQYGCNNFSPIRIAFSDLFDYRYYDIPETK